MVLTAALCSTPQKRDRVREMFDSQIGVVGVHDSDEKGISLSPGIYQSEKPPKVALVNIERL